MYHSQIVYGDTVVYENPALWTLEDMRWLLHIEAGVLSKMFPVLHKIYVEMAEGDDVLPKISPLSSFDDIETNNGMPSSLDEVKLEYLITELKAQAGALVKPKKWNDTTPPFADLFGVKVTKDCSGGYNISDGGQIKMYTGTYPSAIEIKKIVLETYGDAIIQHLTKFFGQAE